MNSLGHDMTNNSRFLILIDLLISIAGGVDYRGPIILRYPTECLPHSPEDGNRSSFRNVVFSSL
jgi:hypothetical protein